MKSETIGERFGKGSLREVSDLLRSFSFDVEKVSLFAPHIQDYSWIYKISKLGILIFSLVSWLMIGGS